MCLGTSAGDCAEPEGLSSPQGKHGNTEVGEHQDRWMSLLTAKSRSVRLMQLLHSPEQFLKVIAALCSMSFLPHQHPSSRHGIYRALRWGINPSLMAINAGGGFWRGEINQNQQSERTGHVRIQLWCLDCGTKPMVNYEKSRECCLSLTARAADSVALATALGSNTTLGQPEP